MKKEIHYHFHFHYESSDLTAISKKKKKKKSGEKRATPKSVDVEQNIVTNTGTSSFSGIADFCKYSEDSKKFLESPELFFITHSEKIPKMQAENLNAAFALNKVLKQINEGMTYKEIALFLNTQKECLNGRWTVNYINHEGNYRNIINFLIRTDRMKKVWNDKHTRYKFYSTASYFNS